MSFTKSKRIVIWRGIWELTEEEERKQLNDALGYFPKTQSLPMSVQKFYEAFKQYDFGGILDLLHHFEKRNEKNCNLLYLLFIRRDLDTMIASIHYTYITSIIEEQISRPKNINRMF